MTEEQVRLFKSDFRIVADYFVQKRQYEDYNPEPQEITHVQTLQLLSVMTGDHRQGKPKEQEVKIKILSQEQSISDNSQKKLHSRLFFCLFLHRYMCKGGFF